MSFHLRRIFPALTVAVAIAVLYLYNLSAVGVLGPDEPRYAAIGRTMAYTGQLVTPRLWGSPWFEKPPLLYWMTALGTWTGLGPETSGRLPVALLSLLFLLASFLLLRREFGDCAAGLATMALATTAGWMAYSSLCLTDIPLAVFFSLAVYLALPLVDGPTSRLRFVLIGICIGLGALAKGLVPIALAVPFAWFLRRHWKQWWIAVAALLVIALPWYIAVYVQNGYPFIEQLFIRHHFERLYSASLQHVQPWWYYIPVLLAGLFPWTPLLLGVVRRNGWDRRKLFLASVVVFGLLMFSVSLNKLPGYVLPLLPPLLALIGAQMQSIGRRWLFACAVLVALIPLLAPILPASLANGRFSWSSAQLNRTEWFYVALPVLAVWFARRVWMLDILVLCVVTGGIYLKTIIDPVLDSEVSARSLWRSTVAPFAGQICDGGTSRDRAYGLSFYAGMAIPFCYEKTLRYELTSKRPPTVEPEKR